MYYLPIYPDLQWHVYDATPSAQIEFDGQTADSQSSTSISQFLPKNPGAHRHSYVPTWSLHWPPFWQGFDIHSFKS